MSAESHLAQYGVTVEQARTFLVDNVQNGNLQNILDVCSEFGVTNPMLAEIYGGVSASDVVNYFASNGYDSTSLINDGLAFTYEELRGHTLYNVFKDEATSPWEVLTFQFHENTLNAQDGFTDNATQFTNLPYEITEAGFLKLYISSEDEVSLDIIAQTTSSLDLYDAAMLSWHNIDNPADGINTPIPESITVEIQYNQAIEGTNGDSGEYFFYNLSDAMAFIA